MNGPRIGSGVWRGTVLAAVLVVLALLGWTRWASSRAMSAAKAQRSPGDLGGNEVMVPELDRARPAQYETATFALG